ncbi:hydrogenase formation protein HypD [Candidatus Frankia alpina]|uniref:Hydrogenase formation protein HypD n=1 Tax=Candidatus Frankia alpina TaxID=2699483 RepID=A0A4S5ENT0_9ACTN|nr:hydrogenase formation protein HypD [Candidatus Frankia alpina]THJ73866.1 hydrogenase formation protein HypD [Candidatus Frankia alpina]
MKYLEEFSDPELAGRLLEQIHAVTTRPWSIMEVCGGQTHSLIRHGIDQLLPAGVEMIHGPGCPVCVTPLEIIDRALEIASRPGVIFCSFGDMLRVPGSGRDLFRVKSTGADVRVVYSPLDALAIARQNPDRQVVFFGIGFETTAPANAMTVYQARRCGVRNFSLLVSHVLVPPAIAAIMESPSCRVQAFLAAGHVCSGMGTGQYPDLARRYRVPIVVTGFEPLDLLEGIRRTVMQLESGRHELDNAYPRAVPAAGNPAAIAMLRDVFTVTDRAWRGIGVIPNSGWRLSDAYREFDAETRFAVGDIHTAESSVCRSGEVLQGLIKPHECAAFGHRCTPRTPLGATMVSAEGACAAYYLYRRLDQPNATAQAGAQPAREVARA